MSHRLLPWWSACLLVAGTMFAEERVALVIGNGKYEGEAALKNPANDADAVAAALAKLDFKVTKKTDLDLPQLEDAIVAFSRGLKKETVAIFFYAGHGVQVKGENFLVPLKADLKEEFQVKQKCYKVDYVLDAMDASNAALKVVILDCCRDNPFTRGWTRGAAGKGLATIAEIPEGAIIAFSTAPGKTALDGRGLNSPYTTHLVNSLNSRPAGGLEITQALRTTAQAVNKEVGQRPWINFDAATAEYYLWNGTSVTTNTPPPETPAKPQTPAPSTPEKVLVAGPPGSVALLRLALSEAAHAEISLTAEQASALLALQATHEVKTSGKDSAAASRIFADEFWPQVLKILTSEQLRRLRDLEKSNPTGIVRKLREEFRVKDGELVRVDAKDEMIWRTTLKKPGKKHLIAVAANGDTVAVLSGRELSMFLADTGKAIWNIEQLGIAADAAHTLSFPDDKQLIIVTAGSVIYVDARTGQIK